jgi:hypothetical protein
VLTSLVVTLLQDKNDKPKNDDPHVFVENKPEEKEFEQSDDTISIKEMKTLMKP